MAQNSRQEVDSILMLVDDDGCAYTIRFLGLIIVIAAFPDTEFGLRCAKMLQRTLSKQHTIERWYITKHRSE